MAITITTAIAANVAAFAPVTLAGSTNRTPFSSGTRRSLAIVSYQDTTSKVDLTVASTTGWATGDTVLIAEATGHYAQFNGRHRVDSVPDGASIILTTAWPGGTITTGDEGTVYKMNDNLNVRCDVINASSVVIAQVYAPVATAGTWSIDLSKPLQSELDSVFTTATGEMNTTKCSHAYTVKVYECWQDVDYTEIAEEDSSEAQSTIAHRTTEYAAARVSGALMNTGNYTAYDKLIILFQTDKTSGVRVAWTRVTLTGIATLNTTYTFASIVNGWAGMVIPFDAGVYAYHTIAIQWNNGSEYETIKTAITIKAASLCETTLYYLNRLGSYEQQVFHDYDDEQQTDKVEYFVAETYQDRELYAPLYLRSEGQSIRDVITSPEVYDNGIDKGSVTKVKVLTDSVLYRSKQTEPTIKIRYNQNHITQ